MAVQLARALGYDVIATASAKNFDLLKKAGASQSNGDSIVNVKFNL